MFIKYFTLTNNLYNISKALQSLTKIYKAKIEDRKFDKYFFYNEKNIHRK